MISLGINLLFKEKEIQWEESTFPFTDRTQQPNAEEMANICHDILANDSPASGIQQANYEAHDTDVIAQNQSHLYKRLTRL
jgi:hypothetical protein